VLLGLPQFVKDFFIAALGIPAWLGSYCGLIRMKDERYRGKDNGEKHNPPHGFAPVRICNKYQKTDNIYCHPEK